MDPEVGSSLAAWLQSQNVPDVVMHCALRAIQEVEASSAAAVGVLQAAAAKTAAQMQEVGERTDWHPAAKRVVLGRLATKMAGIHAALAGQDHDRMQHKRRRVLEEKLGEFRQRWAAPRPVAVEASPPPPPVPQPRPAASTAASPAPARRGMCPQLPVRGEPPWAVQTTGRRCPPAASKIAPATVAATAAALDSTDAIVAETSRLEKEIRYALGLEERPVVVPTTVDRCPRCKVALLRNVGAQHLVCPTCPYWKWHVDMTTTAQSYGAADREYSRSTSDPITHLKTTMKCAEAGEAYQTPVLLTKMIQDVLWFHRIPPSGVSRPLVRNIIYDLKIKSLKADNMVHIHLKLTGITPPRASSRDKDETCIMFSTQTPLFRKHSSGRRSKPNSPSTCYKLYELKGLFEMLESVPLLRGIVNLLKLDSVFQGVHRELNWQFIPTANPFAVMDVFDAIVSCAKQHRLAQEEGIDLPPVLWYPERQGEGGVPELQDPGQARAHP